MNILLVLGDQLFDPKLFSSIKKKETIVWMREDWELCTHFKYHKNKLIFFIAAMRKYALELQKSGFNVHYQTLKQDGESFESALIKSLQEMKPKIFYHFQIEDKFFEARIKDTITLTQKTQAAEIVSPMFLTTRDQFSDYLKKHPRPFMKSFYEWQRRRLNILVTKNGTPTGGRWSFDTENRKALPTGYQPPPIPQIEIDSTVKDAIELVERFFPNHPGGGSDFWLPTDRAGAEKWLDSFLSDRFADFGPYEDALSPEYPFLNHSVLTPFLNVGLLTPQQVVEKAMRFAEKNKTPMATVEGFIRQIIGWREFIRGIYRNFSEVQESKNFWNHHRKLNDRWYQATTGIPPLDSVIKKADTFGYAHHIERLMIVGSLMLLLEVDPQEANRWFMEMFVDSADWVMGPNVYGMALFSDGGIFSTKPYICGSNYYTKMGRYGGKDWQDGVDGLYWQFISRHQEYFSKNPRSSMMVRSLKKIKPDRLDRIFAAAQVLRDKLTQ